MTTQLKAIPGLTLARIAMMLLVLVMTVCTARAELVCQWTPPNGGTVTANGSQVTVTPAAAYCIGSVAWYSGDPNGSEPVSSVVLDNSLGYYAAPSSNGYVVATFIAKSTDVRVSFDLNGYRGDAIADQNLEIGNKVTCPTAPTSNYAEFVGWYEDASGTTPYDFTKTLDYSLPYDMSNARSTLTLYAKWTAHAYHGACGKVDKKQGLDGWEVTWEVSKSTGSADYDVLTISGSGEMADFSSYKGHPWYSYHGTLKSVVIEEGVTSIGKYAFTYTGKQGAEVTIPASVTAIVESAFFSSYFQTITFAESSQLTSIGDKAFQKCSALTTVTIPASVTSIGHNAFNQCSALTTVNFAAGSQLTSIGNKAFNQCSALTTVTIPDNVISIGNYAFQGCKALTTVDFAAGSQLQTIGSNAFDGNYKKNETPTLSSVGTLPASVTSIAQYAFNYFKGDHLYISVPAGYILTVNGKAYTDEITDNKVDLIGYLFKNPNVRTNSKKVTTAVTLSTPYNITITDGTVEAFYNEGIVQITQARERETVTLSWDDETVPEGQYVSGFIITKEKGGTIEATPNEDNTDYTFVMPADNVTVTAQTAPQEEYTLDLTEEEQVALTETQYMLLYTMLGYANYDDTLEGWLIDLNLDGKPDLQMLPPVGEDEETDRDDDFVDEWSVKRLAGADEVTMNYHFAFDYPFPYRYNGMLVKLSDEYSEAVQPQLEELTDGFDNATTLSEWAGDGQTHNVMLTRRTLYRDGKWNTLCLPFDVTISGSALDLPGVEAHKLTEASISGTKLNLTFGPAITTQLEAGVPYIIKWTEATKNIVEPVFYDVTIPDMGITDADREGDDKYEKMEARVDAFYASRGYDTEGTDIVTDERVRFLGTYKSTHFGEADNSILFFSGDNKLYYPKSNVSIGAQRAYFKLGDDDDALAHALTDFTIDFGNGETTNLSSIPSPKGKGEVYDLQGRRVVQPTAKGLYIVNGKKVVIK
jgi:uncharacterized repeat protein (TIGR02543 family)